MISFPLFSFSILSLLPTKKAKRNEGKVPMYHVKDSHEAIIEPEVFDLVQAEIEKRKRLEGSHTDMAYFQVRLFVVSVASFTD